MATTPKRRLATGAFFMNKTSVILERVSTASVTRGPRGEGPKAQYFCVSDTFCAGSPKFDRISLTKSRMTKRSMGATSLPPNVMPTKVGTQYTPKDLQTVMIKRTALLLAALFTAHLPAIAADEPPAKPDRPAEIVVIGGGDMMDALQRAVEDEVKTINEEGGVLGQPVKVSRAANDCTQSPEAALSSAKQIASRQPLVVFDRQCTKTSNETAKIYAENDTLVLGIPVDAPCSQLTSKHPNLFCLGQNHSGTQELAFNIATENPSNIVLLHPDFPAANQAAKAMIDDLKKGFAATKVEEDQWAKLLPPPAYKISSHAFAGGVPFAVSEIGSIALSIVKSPTTSLYYIGPTSKPAPVLAAATASGWKGKLYYSPLPTEKTPPEWLSLLSPKTEVFAIRQQPFYIGPPPEGAKAYTAFHPDWVAGFWQVMKAVKYAKSLDGREIAKSLGGKPFFSRAPWLMLQSRSRYRSPELLQRFNDNGDLRMAGYKLEKIWPK